MPSSDNGRYHSVHHASRKDHDRIKRMALNGGMRSVEDMLLVAEYPEVALSVGFQRWQVRDALIAKGLTEDRKSNGN